MLQHVRQKWMTSPCPVYFCKKTPCQQRTFRNTGTETKPAQKHMKVTHGNRCKMKDSNNLTRFRANAVEPAGPCFSPHGYSNSGVGLQVRAYDHLCTLLWIMDFCPSPFYQQNKGQEKRESSGRETSASCCLSHQLSSTDCESDAAWISAPHSKGGPHCCSHIVQRQPGY